jgi:hypothetical protein
MLDTFLQVYNNQVMAFNHRMMVGPPLSEFEFCLYQQSCRYLEGLARDMADQLERKREREQSGAGE